MMLTMNSSALIRYRSIVFISFLTIAFLAVICRTALAADQAKNKNASFTITSTSFNNNQTIPVQFTGDGKNISPPLTFHGLPPNTKSLALICDDPDAPAGTWVHWLVFDISPAAQGIKEGVPPQMVLADGSKQGRNSFNDIGYGGPAPPPGKLHHYHFKLYALDKLLNLKGDVNKGDLLVAMSRHVLAESELIGTYRR